MSEGPGVATDGGGASEAAGGEASGGRGPGGGGPGDEAPRGEPLAIAVDPDGSEHDPQAFWDALLREQRQVLFDALRQCHDQRWRRHLADLMPAHRDRVRHIERWSKIGCLGVVAFVIAGPCLAIDSDPGFGFSLSGLILILLLAAMPAAMAVLPGLVRPPGLERASFPDLDRLLDAVRTLPGDPWDRLRGRLTDALASWSARDAADVLRSRRGWDDAVAAYAVLRDNPAAAASALAALGKPTSFESGVARRLLKRLPEPGSLPEREAFTVCKPCLARWASRVSERDGALRSAQRPACRRCGRDDRAYRQPVRRIVARVGADPSVTHPRGGPGPATLVESAGGWTLEVDAVDRAGRDTPFDLDAVEVRAADDAGVLALCELVDRDPDDRRRTAARRAPVTVAEGVELDPNTLARLARTFGEVRRAGWGYAGRRVEARVEAGDGTPGGASVEPERDGRSGRDGPAGAASPERRPATAGRSPLRPGEVWAALDESERQLLVDTWSACDDPSWRRSLAAFFPRDRHRWRSLLTTGPAGGLALISVGAVAVTGFLAGLQGVALGAIGVLVAMALAGDGLLRRVGAPPGHGSGAFPDVLRLPALLRRLPRGPWQRLATRIESADRDLSPVDAIGLLESVGWHRQLVGFFGLVGHPARAYRALVELSGPGGDPRPGPWARGLRDLLVAGIPAPPAGRTPEELAVCRACLGRWRSRSVLPIGVRVPGTSAEACCHRCGSGGEVFPQPIGRIIAVLDAGLEGPPGGVAGSFAMGEPTGALVGRVAIELRVDALARTEPFDLDAVEVVAATDAEVEAFCILAGNDPDPLQQRRTRAAPVTLAPGFAPSPNTLAILERTFGEVGRSTGT